ncbi:MAG: putative ABC transporter permease [Lachnospiraceae bacterium]|nr:putative ABC transporter permease [Lachnospiraceae bacterium]
MRHVTMFSAALIIIISSFVGFVIEDTWLALRRGYIDNRNVNLPFLFGYGLAVMGFYLLLGLPGGDGDVLYCIKAALLVSVGEILLGKTVEYTCGIRYWDYSSIPLHITRYTSVPTSLGFGIIITEYMENVLPAILMLAEQFESYRTTLMALGIVLILELDCASSFHYFHTKKEPYLKWKRDLPFLQHPISQNYTG